MILITGGTGQFGGAAIDYLLKKVPASKIASLVRDEKKAESLRAKGVAIRKGDYDDPSSLANALKDVEKLLLVSGPDVARREQQHKNVIDAAMKTGVKHIIYTSYMRKNETDATPLGITGLSHLHTETFIKESGIPYTILRNNLYSEVLPLFFGDQVLEKGIFLPAGDGRIACATREEMAEVAANILAGEGHENKEYLLAHTTNYSLKDIADYLSQISGNQVDYISPTVEEFSRALSESGVPRESIAGSVLFCKAIAQGEYSQRSTDLQNLLGREPVPLEEFLMATYEKKGM